MSDIIYGDVTLPDGRICKAVLQVDYTPQTWDEPEYYSIPDEDPLEATWYDGGDWSDEDYEKHSEYVIEWLFMQGTYEPEVYEPEWGPVD